MVVKIITLQNRSDHLARTLHKVEAGLRDRCLPVRSISVRAAATHSAPPLNRSAIALGRLRGSPLFRGVLALVIVGLLLAVAKLLPKPPAA